MYECHQRFTKHKLQFKWNFDNGDQRLKNNEIADAHSLDFTSGNDNNFKWNLGLTIDLREFRMAVALKLKSSPTSNVRVDGYINFFLRNECVYKLKVNPKCIQIEDRTTIVDVSDWNFLTTMMIFQKIARFSLLCELNVCEDLPISYMNRPPCTEIPNGIAMVYEKLLKSKEDTDFTFLVDNNEFHVHKFIIKARSPVFTAMLNSPMSEQITHQTTVTDVSAEVFEKMIEFMYTDKVSKIEECSKDLFIAAHKYELIGLQALCEDAICDDMEIENAADILILANRHNSQRLLQFTKEFISCNTKAVVRTPKFRELEASEPIFALSLLSEIIRKRF